MEIWGQSQVPEWPWIIVYDDCQFTLPLDSDPKFTGNAD
jgi:hypothetical protein